MASYAYIIIYTESKSMMVHTSQWALDSFSEDRPSQLRMVLEVRYSGSQRSRLDLAQEGLGQANLWGSRLLLEVSE